MTKHYTRDELTIVWKPEQCIHSTKCWKGLLPVFDPRRKPWIDLSGAEKTEIMEQVSKCPSGALSYLLDVDTKDEASEEETHMTTSVEVMKNGPLMVYGNITVKDAAGKEEKKSKVTAFCRCGASANKPFCDGSHIRIEFKG